MRNTIEMSKIIDKIKNDLRSKADEKTKLQGEKFFKESVNIYGLKSAILTEKSKKKNGTINRAIYERDKRNAIML